MSIATLVVPVTFGKYRLKTIIAITAFMNGLLSVVISMTSFIPLIYISRFGQGFFAAFACIYAPIWINHFSPADKSATWMGIF
jgi:MFS family permease